MTRVPARPDLSACSRAVTLLLTGLLCSFSPVNAQKNYSGICLSPAYDWVPHKMFADAVKMGRGFQAINTGDSLALDRSGWPLGDARILVWQDPVHMQGTYRLYYTTQSAAVDARTVTASVWPARTLTNQRYDAAANTVTYDFVVTDTGGSICRLTFTNTRGGVKNVKLMRPTTVGGSTPCDTSVTFTPDFLRAMSKFQGIRAWALVDGGSKNMVANWSDRTTPGYSCQQARSFGSLGGTAGVAWEYMTQLCNEAGIDLWVNVQFHATDDYVRQLATLIMGTLRPERRIYVEYSNELWNWAGDYDCRRNYDTAAAEVARGGSPLGYDGATGQVAAWRRIAKRGKEVSDVFRSVFGDGAMMSRVRPMLMTQLGNGQNTLGDALAFLQGYYNNPAQVNTPHAPNYYFYGAGGAPYYRPTGTYDISTVWQSGSMDIDTFERQQLKTEIPMCAAFGLKRIAYEGGAIAFDRSAAWAAANDDPRMTTAMVAHHDAWSNYGGDEFYYSDLTGWSYNDQSGNFMHYIEEQTTTRMRALDSLNAASRAPITVGRAVPGSFPGSPTDYTEHSGVGGWHEVWRSYMIRVDQPGVYGITVNVSNVRSEAVLVLADATQIGSFTPTGTGSQTTPKYTVTLAAGLHGILVPFASGVFNVNQITVTFEGPSAVVNGVRSAAQRSAPVLQVAGNRVRIDVGPGRAGSVSYAVCTLNGRSVLHGTVGMSSEGTGETDLVTRVLGSGVYFVRSGNRTAATALMSGSYRR
jgi:hypothetical protein